MAFIGYGSIYDNSTRDRYRGFQAYCQMHGIGSEIIYYEGRHHEFNEKLPELLQETILNKAIDGIFVVNDEQAYEVLSLLHKNKVRVPEDVQVIGFDGSQQSTNIPSSLSSIRQPIPAIAAAAVKCLINVIEKKEAPLKTILPVTYHPGTTTKV